MKLKDIFKESSKDEIIMLLLLSSYLFLFSFIYTSIPFMYIVYFISLIIFLNTQLKSKSYLTPKFYCYD